MVVRLSQECLERICMVRASPRRGGQLGGSGKGTGWPRLENILAAGVIYGGG